MNDGKKFERDFIDSVPVNWFKYKLRDSAHKPIYATL